MKEEKLNHNTKNQDEEKHIKASKEETLTDDTKTDIKQDLKNEENSHAKETDIKEDEKFRF